MDLLKKTNAKKGAWDCAGIIVSGACLIHCIALPFAAGILPVLGLELLMHEYVHKGLALVLIITTIFAFIPGYALHKNNKVWFFAIPGVSLLLFAAFILHSLDLHELELPINILGGTCLIVAHILNRTFCNTCSDCKE